MQARSQIVYQSARVEVGSTQYEIAERTAKAICAGSQHAVMEWRDEYNDHSARGVWVVIVH